MNNNKKANISGQGKDQDNIGYENTERRADRDDREMNRLQTTDTDNDEGKIPDVSLENEDAEEDDEEKVFGQL
jgi:hypothetical protein